MNQGLVQVEIYCLQLWVLLGQFDLAGGRRLQGFADTQRLDCLQEVLPGERDEVAILLDVRRLGDTGSVIAITLCHKSGAVLGLGVVLLPSFEEWQFEVVLDALTVYLLPLVVQLAPPQQFLKGEVAARLDLLLHERGRLLGAVSADLAVEGGTDIEVVGLIVE